MTDARPRHDSVVRLGERSPWTFGRALAVTGCWTLLVLGVVLVPALLLFRSVLAGWSFEPTAPSSGGGEALAWFWAARLTATASALGVLAITVVVTARGGRLVNGWIVLVLTLPVVALLWDMQVV